MNSIISPNALNQFTKGTHFYKEGEPVSSIAMILKGRVLIHNEGLKVVAGAGSFLGIQDINPGKYQSTYTACEDVMLYIFPISRMEELVSILSVNKDYHGFMVASYYRMISDLDQIYQNLEKHTARLHQFITETYQEYVDSATRRGYKVKTSERLESIALPDNELDVLSDRINYYSECRNLPLEVVKAFFSYGNAITLYQVEDQVSIINQQIEMLRSLSADFFVLSECLIDDTDNCLYRIVAELALEMKESTGDGQEAIKILDDIIEEAGQAEQITEKNLGRKFTFNRSKTDEIRGLILSGNKEKDISSEMYLRYSKEDSDKALVELEDSFTKLLQYAEIPDAIAVEMKKTHLDFVNLKDKNSADDSVRKIRRQLSEHHYELYKAVFLKSYREKQIPRLIDLFLRYGYSDEKLLTKEQLLSLYFLKTESSKENKCKVYDIKEWLTLIYEGKKEPSKNEFDQEYPETVRELRKQAKITEKEEKEWLVNKEKKLEYEIKNMFRYNNRTTSGQISTFVPILHKDQWTSKHMERLYVTSDKVNESISELMKIDYSVFDRELLYVNEEKNITKEYVMKRVYPDIILMPCVGSNGIMWQEITGRRRDTPGRFLLPIFTDMNLKNLLVRMMGRYRWELCRTIEGTAWNDIKHKSLTSEYSDYLQFYRKNKDLSEEKREKVKAQILKGRNNSREIFSIDYEQWINYEAAGAIKLNKPVREIMATYCPFAKDIRERVKSQPLFEEAMARFYREKQKKIREIESRYRFLQKDSIELTQELIDTLEYHTNS